MVNITDNTSHYYKSILLLKLVSYELGTSFLFSILFKKWKDFSTKKGMILNEKGI